MKKNVFFQFFFGFLQSQTALKLLGTMLSKYFSNFFVFDLPIPPSIILQFWRKTLIDICFVWFSFMAERLSWPRWEIKYIKTSASSKFSACYSQYMLIDLLLRRGLSKIGNMGFVWRGNTRARENSQSKCSCPPPPMEKYDTKKTPPPMFWCYPVMVSLYYGVSPCYGVILLWLARIMVLARVMMLPSQVPQLTSGSGNLTRCYPILWCFGFSPCYGVSRFYGAILYYGQCPTGSFFFIEKMYWKKNTELSIKSMR